MLPVNGALPRHARSSPPQDPSKNRWQGCYVVSLTLFASAILATLVTFGVLNFLLNGVTLPPVSTETGLLHNMQQQDPQLQLDTVDNGGIHPPQLATEEGSADASMADAPVHPPNIKPPPAVMKHPFDDLQKLYTIPEQDSSPRCKSSQICDGDHSCGPDKLGCVTSAEQRKAHVRKAIAWAWEGYRKYAWGHDEVDVLSKSPHAWFNLGLTIVDSLDTLLIAGLMDEYLQARHWVANHLVFHDGSNVQFFEVNIRILGGLVSAYYLSGGDDLYLHKAEQLSDRLLVAFNTSSGVPVTHVTLQGAAGRAGSGMPDAQTNIAEAGTISMEFTSIGRLLGRDDLFDAGMQFWYVLMSSQNFSGLYCMGIHTSRANCYNPMMTIGSAADSTYEYMLKQWVMSNHTQDVPLQLYIESMKGVRKYLVRHVWDGTAEGSIVSEARADMQSGVIGDTNNRFEHLTCFAGGMFVLGALHGVNTELDEKDFHDAILGARIGRTCYELYHQTASGLAPDSVTFKLEGGRSLPPRDQDTVRPAGTIKRRPSRRQPAGEAPQQPTTSKADGQQPATDNSATKDAQAPKLDVQAPKADAPGQHKAEGAPAQARTLEPTQTARHLQAAGEHGHEHSSHQQPHERQHMGRHLMALEEEDEEAEQQQQQQQQQEEEQLRYLRAGAAEIDSHRSMQDRHQAPHHSWHQLGGEEAPRAWHYLHPDPRDGHIHQHQLLHEKAAAAYQHSMRHMPPDDEPFLHQHPHRPMRQLHDDGFHEPLPHHRLRRMHADAEQVLSQPNREQPHPVDDGAHGPDAIRAAREREAAAAAHQQHVAEHKHMQEQHDAEARLRQAAQELQQQQAAQQRQNHAPGTAPGARGAAPDDGQRKATPRPPPPNPPPPPAGPVKAVSQQMTAADFLRPETIETLFYLWRATGDEIYREWGWNMFRAFERWTRLDSGGYATVNNVNAAPPGLANKMESFWLAETLKYFYLLFEDDPNVLPLDQWVFNTEAHPLPIWGTPADKQAMARLKQRRHGAKVEQQKRATEEAAVAELKEIKRQGAALAKHGPQPGKPNDRQGYGLGGLDMY